VQGKLLFLGHIESVRHTGRHQTKPAITKKPTICCCRVSGENALANRTIIVEKRTAVSDRKLIRWKRKDVVRTKGDTVWAGEGDKTT
jgi:hypothetical protein